MQKTSRKTRWIVVGLLCAAAVLLGVLLPLGGGKAGTDEALASEEAGRRGRGPGHAHAEGEGAHSEEGEGPGEESMLGPCWSNLSALDAALTLGNFREALAQLLRSEDPLLQEYLVSRLAELVGSDLASAQKVLDWVNTASEAESELLLAGLRKSAAGQNPAVADRLFALGEDGTKAQGTRLAAIEALQSQRSLDGAKLARLKKLALSGPSDELAWLATRTMGTVMNESFSAGGDYKPYWDNLLEIAKSSSDPAVRQLAMEAPTHSDVILGKESIPTLADMMSNDDERDLREQAAFRLSLTDDPQQALKSYEAAFKNEYDECVRWAIFRFALRAAGQDALPLLQQFAQLDARFAKDLEEFQKLYAQGHVDFERVWINKSEEHHACVVEEGQRHGG